MGCDFLSLRRVYVYKRPRVNDLYSLSDVLEGNGVVVFRTAHVDEAVGADQKFAAVFYFEAFSPQRFQGGLIYGDEAFFPGERQTLHPPLVVKRHLLRYRLVELLNGKEPAVAQRSIYIVIGKLDMILDQRLVISVAVRLVRISPAPHGFSDKSRSMCLKAAPEDGQKA